MSRASDRRRRASHRRRSRLAGLRDGLRPALRVAAVYGPGTVAYWLLFAWSYSKDLFQDTAVDYLLQSLGGQILTSDPAAALAANHIQPPGLNAIFALAIALPGSTRIALAVIFALFGWATVLLIASALRNLGQSMPIAAGASLVFAVLPSTMQTVMFPYTTIVVGFLGALSLWGLSLLGPRPRVGLVVWTAATVALALTRPSFLWIVALAGLAVIVLFAGRGLRSFALAAAAIGAVAILGVQLHYLTSFGQTSMSSWSGQNLIKGLYTSKALTKDQIVASAGSDPCLRELATKLDFWPNQKIAGAYPVCTADYADEGTEDFTREGVKGVIVDAAGKELQVFRHNTVPRLKLAASWDDLAARVVADHPDAFLEVVLGQKTYRGSVELMFQPGFQHALTAPQLEKTGRVVGVFRPLGVVFPAASFGLLVLGVVLSIRARGSAKLTLRQRQTLWFGAAIMAYGMTVAGLLEYGENERYLTELYPVLTISAALTVGVVLRRFTEQDRLPAAAGVAAAPAEVSPAAPAAVAEPSS